MAYSNNLRIKALDYIEKGRSKVEASQVFGVTVQTLIAWCKRKRQGNLAPNTTKTRQPQKLETEKLKAYIEKHSDSYLREIAEEFKVTITAVFYACKRLKIALKKTPFYKERDENEREEFRKKLEQILQSSGRPG